MGAWPGEWNQGGGKFGQGSWPEGAGVALPSARRSTEPAIPWLTEKAVTSAVMVVVRPNEH